LKNGLKTKKILMMRSYQNCFEKLEEHAEAAKAEGKIVFVKRA